MTPRLDSLSATAPDTVADSLPPREMPPQGPEKPFLQPQDTVPATSGPSPQASPDTASQVPPIMVGDSGAPRLQTYNPSSMLGRGQWEAKLYQQLYSQTHYFDAEGRPQPQNARSSYYTAIAGVTLGWRPRLNVGAEVWLRSVRIDDPASSPLATLTFASGPGSRTGLSAVGPKVKWQPIARWNALTLQSALLIPVGRDLEGHISGRPFLATANLVWWTQVYWSRLLGRKWQVFAEADVYAAMNLGRPSQGQPSHVALPVSGFLSHFLTRRVTLYAMTQVWPTTNSLWWQAGGGAKLRIGEGLELDAMYGRFLAGLGAAGQANAFNLGIRFVKW